MKRKIFYSFVALGFAISLTGCGKTESIGDNIKLEKGKFSITCSTDENEVGGMTQKLETTYNFNEEENAINYEVVTTQKFKDESTYKTYKDAQIDTVKSNSSKEILYNLKSDDAGKQLIFTMAITKIDINQANQEEKENLKASSVLKSVEETTDPKYTCKVEGIDRSALK